jgi:predicted kinase
MPTPPSARSVKISDDERGGWSSDRPRRQGAGPARPADVSVRSTVLRPTDRLRYSPGSLLLIASADPAQRDGFVERLVEDRSALLSLSKVRRLLAGRVADEDIDARAADLLDAAVAKRLGASETVVVPLETLQHEERDRFVRIAARAERPRHLILLDSAPAQTSDEDKAALAELRRNLMAGDLGSEGFHTALRLSGPTVAEVKKLLFRPAPRDD